MFVFLRTHIHSWLRWIQLSPMVPYSLFINGNLFVKIGIPPGSVINVNCLCTAQNICDSYDVFVPTSTLSPRLQWPLPTLSFRHEDHVYPPDICSLDTSQASSVPIGFAHLHHLTTADPLSLILLYFYLKGHLYLPSASAHCNVLLLYLYVPVAYVLNIFLPLRSSHFSLHPCSPLWFSIFLL